jgi:hypothetical protein
MVASPGPVDQTAAAALIGLKNPKTLAQWRLRRCGPPYFKVGRLCRYDPAQLRAWLEARTVKM